MIGIKEIFFWGRNFQDALMPENLTSIQKEAWKKSNKEITVNTTPPPFTGDRIKIQAVVRDIESSTILAYYNVRQGLHIHEGRTYTWADHDGNRSSLAWDLATNWLLGVELTIRFSNKVLSDSQLLAMDKQSTFEFIGDITHCRFSKKEIKSGTYHYSHLHEKWPNYQIDLALDLVSISKIDTLQNPFGDTFDYWGPKKNSWYWIVGLIIFFLTMLIWFIIQ